MRARPLDWPTLSYRCLQILMASTLLPGVSARYCALVTIGLLAAGEAYHHWYAWDRARQLRLERYETAQELLTEAGSSRQARSADLVAHRSNAPRRRAVGD